MRNRRWLKHTDLGPRDIPLLHTASHPPGTRPPSPSLEGLCQGSRVATAEACYGTQPAALAAAPPFLWPKRTTKKLHPWLPTMFEIEDLKAQVNMNLAALEMEIISHLYQEPHSIQRLGVISDGWWRIWWNSLNLFFNTNLYEYAFLLFHLGWWKLSGGCMNHRADGNWERLI